MFGFLKSGLIQEMSGLWLDVSFCADQTYDIKK